MTSDEIGERVARLEAHMESLLEVPTSLARLEGKVDQIVKRNGTSKWTSVTVTALSSAIVALLVVILTHALAK
jgi:hypothetical protein